MMQNLRESLQHYIPFFSSKMYAVLTNQWSSPFDVVGDMFVL